MRVRTLSVYSVIKPHRQEADYEGGSGCPTVDCRYCGNFATLERMTADAASSGPGLVLLPEAVLNGLINTDDPAHDLPLGQTIPGPATLQLGKLCARHDIWLGFGMRWSVKNPGSMIRRCFSVRMVPLPSITDASNPSGTGEKQIPRFTVRAIIFLWSRHRLQGSLSYLRRPFR